MSRDFEYLRTMAMRILPFTRMSPHPVVFRHLIRFLTCTKVNSSLRATFTIIRTALTLIDHAIAYDI